LRALALQFQADGALSRVESLSPAGAPMSRDPEGTGDVQKTSALDSPDATAAFRSNSTHPTGSESSSDLPSIPGYDVSYEIAKGGMGRVLAGTELALEREVAIKVLLPGANAERFVSESKITAKLPHPNIPPIYSLGTLADGSPYLAMKFVRGRTLSAELKSRPNALHDLPRFVQVFEQICQAVGFAHSQHIVHRDLKPANVMMGAFGEVQVMDWGLAKELRRTEGPAASASLPEEAQQSSDLTMAGAVMGTPAYMAPEQARGEAVDARADVFALGGILCNLLTGQAVHTGHSVSETINKAATGQLAEALERLDRCGADAELVNIARQCLAADRQQRPIDAQTVAKLIGAYRQGVETRLHEAEAERASAKVREAEQLKRRRLFYRLGGAVAAILLLGIVGTSIGLVQANRAAAAERLAKDEERIAKDDAIEQTRKAEGRLMMIRSTINQFTNDLPAIGESLPLSEGLRKELKALSTKLVTSIRDQHDLNDTYDLGLYSLAIREGREASFRKDYAEARRKAVYARDGFQKILDSNPQLIDRSKNNLAMALTELARCDIAEQHFDAAEANLQKALALRREIIANPHGDQNPSLAEESLGSSLMLYGLLESQRKRYDRATEIYRETNELFEHAMQTESDRQIYERLLLNWAEVQRKFANLAELVPFERKDEKAAMEGRKQAVVIRTAIIERLQDELKATPDSVAVRVRLANEAAELGHYIIDWFKDYRRGLKYCEIAVHHRRWFWDSKEIVDLRDGLGLNYYELGLFAEIAKQPEASKKHYHDCLAFWQLNLQGLEGKGEPADSELMLGAKTLVMLAQGRCGMTTEVELAAANFLEQARKPTTDKKKKQTYATQSAVGYGFCAITFPPGSKERTDYFRKAMISLREGVAFGYNDWHWLETDEDFEPLRQWPEYNQAVAEWKAGAGGRK
jgi:tetratricopeptide (TPR) repeat protein